MCTFGLRWQRYTLDFISPKKQLNAYHGDMFSCVFAATCSRCFPSGNTYGCSALWDSG